MYSDKTESEIWPGFTNDESLNVCSTLIKVGQTYNFAISKFYLHSLKPNRK